ncbi:MAG: GNAT family N-acetyltransferase, partial [Candidatus Eremiobacteraeota bacterium]|nr:GNAT family N-acetyltransferase [Candidatus Eremiobacteraeota bacterium]
MSILVTGFEPFAGASRNPSAEVLDLVEHPTLLLPVDSQAAFPRLQERARELHPKLLVCLGEARGSAFIRVERLAVNLNDFNIPDSAGRVKVDEAVVEGGPPSYWSTADTRGWLAALHQAGLAAELSYSAGTYLCNQVYYQALHHLLAAQVVFLHLPTQVEITAVARVVNQARPSLTDHLVHLSDWLFEPPLAHAQKVTDYLGRNRDFHRASSPRRQPDFYQNFLLDYHRQRETRRLFCLYDQDRVVGHVELSQIARGPLQAAYLGYALDQQFQGRGLMRRALEAVIAYAFGDLGLHRLMANHRPDNQRSARLLARLGFETEGIAKAYLKLDNEWQDHVLTALVTPTHSKTYQTDLSGRERW